jgi:hypothetical protein
VGQLMPLTVESLKRRVDSLTLIGGLIALVDSAWGGFAAIGLDSTRTNELVLAISLVLSFPAYVLDLWIDDRIAVSLIAVFLFRWIAVCFGGPTVVFCWPWRGSILLILAFVLLQSSKLRRGITLGRNALGS